MVVPVAEETFYISKYLNLFPSYCNVLCSNLPTLELLHDKWKFSQLIKSHESVKTIPTIQVTDSKSVVKVSISNFFYMLKKHFTFFFLYSFWEILKKKKKNIY